MSCHSSDFNIISCLGSFLLPQQFSCHSNFRSPNDFQNLGQGFPCRMVCHHRDLNVSPCHSRYFLYFYLPQQSFLSQQFSHTTAKISIFRPWTWLQACSLRVFGLRLALPAETLDFQFGNYFFCRSVHSRQIGHLILWTLGVSPGFRPLALWIY